jgi:hypothetical protein
MEDHNVAMFDNLVVVAKRFYGIIPRGEGEKELQFLLGQVDKLKKRLYSIKVYTCHGEDACGKYRKETINSNAWTHTTLEEIVSKSTLLCGDRTQENA